MGKEVPMKTLAGTLLLCAGLGWASVIVGSPDVASMDPFCAS